MGSRTNQRDAIFRGKEEPQEWTNYFAQRGLLPFKRLLLPRPLGLAEVLSLE